MKNQIQNHGLSKILKTVFLIFGILFSCQFIFAQTAVKMKLPQQSAEPLSIAVLYKEPVKAGTIVVMAAFGYQVSGGFQWLKDNQVIATGDIAVVTPTAGSNYSLKITDKNNCNVTQSINISAQNKIRQEVISDEIIVAPTLVTDHITIAFTDNSTSAASLRIVDLQGITRYEITINGNTIVPVSISAGAYFVVINRNEQYSVKKIIVQ